MRAELNFTAEYSNSGIREELLSIPWPSRYPGSSWEENVPVLDWFLWFCDTRKYVIHICLVYLSALVVGQWVMSARKPFDLRWALLLWNTALTLFSAIGSYRTITYTIYTLRYKGIYDYLCLPPAQGRHTVLLWSLLFASSKVIEFGDTAFLILRKRPVIHLHWIHHTLTFTVCIFLGSISPIGGIQGVVINYTIHTFMYGYYAARAAGLQIPSSWAKWITRSQIAQMLLNFVSCIYVFYVIEFTPRPCYNDPIAALITLVIMGLFTALFLNFFVQTYIKRARKGREAKEKVREDKEIKAEEHCGRSP